MQSCRPLVLNGAKWIDRSYYYYILLIDTLELIPHYFTALELCVFSKAISVK